MRPRLSFCVWIVLVLAACQPAIEPVAQVAKTVVVASAEPQPSPTETQIPPTTTPTRVPPTATQPPPTDTPLPPTATLVPLTPTDTEVPLPTATPVVFVDEFGVAMVLVPAGPFVMGSEKVVTNAPPHVVVLDDYYIDQFEVTNELFAMFLSEFDNQREGGAPWLQVSSSANHIHLVDGVWQVDEGYEDRPVVEVTWYGAKAFCQWRGARLPTEAEWEKAARGTDERTFPWGEDLSCRYANYGSCSVGEGKAVGGRPLGVSPYGAHDMAGNVAEWTGDWYVRDYYLNSPESNPPGPEESPTNKIASRGGSWYSTSMYLRTFHRNNEFYPTSTLSNVGFRCARMP
jgi:formylglycine-generating enzyme required for sulfatase activity